MPGPHSAVELQEAGDLLSLCAMKLSRNEREAINLMIDGKTVREVAAELGVCPAHAQRLQVSGLAKLRREMAHLGITSIHQVLTLNSEDSVPAKTKQRNSR